MLDIPAGYVPIIADHFGLYPDEAANSLTAQGAKVLQHLFGQLLAVAPAGSQINRPECVEVLRIGQPGSHFEIEDDTAYIVND